MVKFGLIAWTTIFWTMFGCGFKNPTFFIFDLVLFVGTIGTGLLLAVIKWPKQSIK